MGSGTVIDGIKQEGSGTVSGGITGGIWYCEWWYKQVGSGTVSGGINRWDLVLYKQIDGINRWDLVLLVVV